MESLIESLDYFQDFHPESTRRLVLIQIDIEGHSAISAENNPIEVMNMKAALAGSLTEKLKAEHDFHRAGWQGDGGMFALNVTNKISLVDNVVSAWQTIVRVTEEISNSYKNILPKGADLIPLRVSAHLCYVLVHKYPQYWHSEELNAFAKAERDLGIRGGFAITSELFRHLSESNKKRFSLSYRSVLIGKQSDVYEYSYGVPGDKSMSFNQREMMKIVGEARSFKFAIRSEPQIECQTVNNPSKDTKIILIIVDLQQDFCDDQSMGVEGADDIAEKNYNLALSAIEQEWHIVVTRDWHSEDRFSHELWSSHCIQETPGAEFISKFNIKEIEAKLGKKLIKANIGFSNEIPDYNPYFFADLRKFMLGKEPECIYVSGIALEYCVLSTCIASQAYAKQVIALEDYICSAKKHQAEFAWKLLEQERVVRRKGNPIDSNRT